MSRPRIILADTDESYISPLEMKFIDELQDGIDLEVITDRQYFNELMSKPQKADILLVSENIYSDSLKKHDIANLFVLAEQNTEDGSRQDNVIRLYKYSSIKEIYSKVISASVGVVIENDKPKETDVILVYSPSGGVGKTTIALGICECMSKNFKRVLYVNAERLNTFQYMMKDQVPLPSVFLAGIAGESRDAYQSVKSCIRNEGFDYIPPFGAALSVLNVDYGFYEQVIRAAKATMDYDVIVVDSDMIFDDYKARLASLADKVIIVTTPGDRDKYAANILMKSMNLRDSEKYYFICNDVQNSAARQQNGMNEHEKSDIADYVIDEYMGYVNDPEKLTISGLGSNNDMQRISFLIF